MILSDLVYVASSQETWDQAALNIYGNEVYSRELMEANPALITKTVFDGGEKLNLPVLDVVEPGEESYMPSTPPWKE